MELETGRHLFQAPRYSSGGRAWSGDFLGIASDCQSLTFDTTAVFSCLAHGYACGNRTLVREVKRQPWMSEIGTDGEVLLADVPEHGFFKYSPRQIAQGMLRHLEAEALAVCKGHSNIYLLTSGGLDSRIVAGVVRRLLDRKEIDAKVIAITWGLPASRDVEIGRVVAEKLNFTWKHLELDESHLFENVELAANLLGAMVSPVHLHRMSWFRDLPPGGLVLGGSYGDSIGRAEFSGRSVLELMPFRGANRYGLLREELLPEAVGGYQEDLREFRERIVDRPEYGKRECEQQGHYMRGMIAQTMSIINGPCSLYQMFTSPAIIKFMWSIHPCFRNNQPYAEILPMLGNDLHRLPWARTNRPIGNVKSKIEINASHNKFHKYASWVKRELLPHYRDETQAWVQSNQLICPTAFESLWSEVAKSEIGRSAQSHNLLAWLLSLMKFEKNLKPIVDASSNAKSTSCEVARKQNTNLRSRIKRIEILAPALKKARKQALKFRAIKQYPPVDPER